VVSTIVGVFLISLSIYDYDFAVPFVLLLGLGSTAYLVWHLGSKWPSDIANDILRRVPGAWATAAPLSASGGGAAASQPWHSADSPAEIDPSGPPPKAEPTSNIFDQIKQLAGLRDAGAITSEEFDSKKTELLKRL
jgi:hypothetical protein